jgi:hypothetical protein
LYIFLNYLAPLLELAPLYIRVNPLIELRPLGTVIALGSRDCSRNRGGDKIQNAIFRYSFNLFDYGELLYCLHFPWFFFFVYFPVLWRIVLVNSISPNVQHYTWNASQIVVQHHTSFELPSHDAVGGPRLLGSGHFVQLCLETPRFGAHATCSSCWESLLFLLTKNVLQPLGALTLGSVTLDHGLLGTTR